MSTPYSEVFDSFLSKIEDIDYAKMEKQDVEKDMITLLTSACVQFEYPKVNIDERDDSSMFFYVQLNQSEIEILSTLMTLEWIKRKIKSISVIRQAMTDRDFRLTSQANHLNTLLRLKKDTENDIEKLKTTYSYTTNRKPNYDGLAGG